MTALIARFFAAPHLGHGRRSEAMLASICWIYGIGIFCFPSLALDSKATVDLYWEGYGSAIGLPFIVQAVFTTWGLMANINGWSYSRSLRCVGALAGSFIWTAMLWKFIAYGSPFSFGSVCAIVFLHNSVGIFGRALVNLPTPGAPGAR